jgi:hypothetical protein
MSSPLRERDFSDKGRTFGSGFFIGLLFAFSDRPHQWTGSYRARSRINEPEQGHYAEGTVIAQKTIRTHAREINLQLHPKKSEICPEKS